jgi:hypothetical protein
LKESLTWRILPAAMAFLSEALTRAAVTSGMAALIAERETPLDDPATRSLLMVSASLSKEAMVVIWARGMA